MLTASEAISSNLLYYSNKGSKTVASDQDARDFGRFNLLRATQKVWHLAPLWYRTTQTSGLILTANSSITPTSASVAMPANFESMGRDANVFLTPGQLGSTQLPPLRPVGQQVLLNARRLFQLAVSYYPTNYTLYTKTPGGLATIYVFPVNAAQVSIDILGYVALPPDMIDRPGAPAVVDSGSAGNLTGNYQWATTFVTSNGECEFGPKSPLLTLTTHSAVVTPAVSASKNVTSRKVYRTVAGGSILLLAGTINDNLPTSSLTDNVADGALGVAAPYPVNAISGLEQFSLGWHESLIVTGLIAYSMLGKGDERADPQIAAFEKEVVRLWAEEKQGQNYPKTMPRYAGASPFQGGWQRPRFLS